MSVSRRWTIGLVATGLVLLVAANAHLVVVAVTSQPECVDRAGAFQAAKSSCPSGVRP